MNAKTKAVRKCVVCGARVRNINPKTKTCGPTCTRFYNENKERVGKVLRYEDAVRRDIERILQGENV